MPGINSMAMSPWRQPGSAMRRRTRALGHRSALRSLFLAGVLLPSMPALACSPAAFPQHALREGGVGTRLLRAMAERFRHAGVRKLRTIVARENTLILSFFRSQGMMAGPLVALETDLEP